MPKTLNSHPTDLVCLLHMMIVKTLHYLLNIDLFVLGLARFMYTIKLNDTCAGSAVYIIRSYTRVNQLHESRGCMDLLSNTCLNRRRIYCHSTVCIGMTFVSIFFCVYSVVFESARLFSNVKECVNML